MATTSGYTLASRPRTHLQYQQKESSVPIIRTVQAEEDSDIVMDELDERSVGGSSEEEEEEEEVDQLDSTEDEAEAAHAPAGQSASTGGANKPPRSRTRKHEREKALERSLAGLPPIPISRIENMLEPDVSEPMSKESLFILSAATDAFIRRLAEAGNKKANGMRRLTITYHDIASAIQHHPEFSFLEETIPQPLGLADALKRRELKEKDLLEPLLSKPQPAFPIPPSVPQSLSIPLPLINDITIPGSLSASNAPSPRPSVQSVSQASASTSQTAGGKPKRKPKQANGSAAASVNGNGDLASADTAVNEDTAMASVPSVAVDGTNEAVGPNLNATPNAPPMPRRQSLREPKPRRRPDGQDVLPKPAPPQNLSAQESTEVESAKPAAATTRGGKTRGTRGRGSRGRGKANASPVVSHSDASTAPNAPTRNGVHLHANGNGMMVTRSRRGSAVAAQPSAPNAASADLGSRPDDAKWHTPERSAGSFTGPGSVSLDSPAPSPFSGAGRNGLTDNPGRTIYSQQRAPTNSATR